MMTVGGFEARLILLCVPHQAGQFLMDYFDHLLPWREAFQNLMPDRPFLDLRNKILYHQVIDICFQQSQTDFPQCGVDIFSVSLPLALSLRNVSCKRLVKLLNGIRLAL